MSVIDLQNLTKRYGRFRGIEDVTLRVESGEVFGFLGANGAGKTTTIRLLLDLTRPTSGKAAVFGLDTRAGGPRIRERLGYLPGEMRLYERQTGIELLDYLTGLSRRTPVLRQTLADRLELSQSDLKKSIRQYSRGMKQKIGLIQAAQHDPELLILDEPTEGLDPLAKSSFYAFLQEFRDRGRTVFISSHVLSEVERTCDRVAIIREGRLAALEGVEALKNRMLRHVEVEFAGAPPVEALKLPGVQVQRIEGRRVMLTVKGTIGPLIDGLAPHRVLDLISEKASLEDIFLEFYRTGGGTK